MIEREIEQYLVKRCKEVHFACYKFVSPSNRGVPDRLILGPKGLHCFVECKSSIGKTTKLQDYVIESFRSLGHRVYIVNSKEEVDNVIQAVTATVPAES